MCAETKLERRMPHPPPGHRTRWIVGNPSLRRGSSLAQSARPELQLALAYVRCGPMAERPSRLPSACSASECDHVASPFGVTLTSA